MFGKEVYNKILKNKYDVLKTRIMLTNDPNFTSEFEKTVREIEKNSEQEYEEKLKNNIYIATTLEEEKIRLNNLINVIDKRMIEQSNVISDFRNLTGRDMTSLTVIKEANKINDYKIRLSYIEKYLVNKEEIEKQKDIMEDLNIKLKIEEKEKNENSKENDIVNKQLDVEFNKVKEKSVLIEELLNSEYNETEFNKILEDKKSSLDIILKSYNNILGQGISGVAKDEYSSYVIELKEDYYVNKLKEDLFNIKKLLNLTASNYEEFFNKVEKIKKILEDNEKLKKDLNIQEFKDLIEFHIFVREKYMNLVSQKNNIINVKKIEDKINDCKEIIKSLENENNDENILSILREFCLIERKKYSSNAIIDVKEASNMDVDTIVNKALVVLEKVSNAIL